MTAGNRAQSAGYSRHELEARLESLAAELQRSADTALSLQALLDHNAVPTSQVDADGRIVVANRALSTLTGIPHNELIGSNLATAERWSHDPAANARLRVALEAAWSGEPSAFEGVAELPIGRRCIRILLTPGIDPDGTVTHLIANGFDITDALAAETAQAETARIRAIEQSARQLQAVIDESPVSIYAKDRSGAFMFVNRAFEQVMGTTREEIVGRRPSEFPHRADRVRLDAQDRRVFETGASVTGEATFSGPSGDGPQTFLLNKFPLRDLNEEIYAVCVIATDITPLRAIEAERSLRARRNELIGSLATMAAEGALLPELRSAACDAALTGLGARFVAVVEVTSEGPRLAEATEPIDLAAEPTASEVATDACRTMRAASVAHAVAVPVLGAEGALALCAELAEGTTADQLDVTFLEELARLLAGANCRTRAHELEQQLLHAQRLESVGKLAGGIAHDFNNLLSVILNYAAFVDEGLKGSNEQLREDVSEIIEAAQRAADLTRRLLLFGRGENASQACCDANGVIGDMVAILGRMAGDEVTIELSLAGGGREAQIAADELEQVVAALVVNAHEAMPAGGTVRIATSSQPNHVQIIFSDNGAGMTAAVREHALDPFFTTKVAGEGSGLGLSTVHGIIRRTGGTIALESALGVGTTVRITLPTCPCPDLSDPDTEGAETAHNATGPLATTVLLVDDQAPVRAIVQRILEDAGYRVLPAEAPAKARAIAAVEKVDLLVTDLILPSETGPELAASIGMSSSGLRTLYVSGLSVDELANFDQLYAGARVLPRPFSRELLLSEVATALREGGDEQR